jgi:hypothetical protein
VELLLEGMAGPRPDRRKTKPQSDGEASAAYHAEHGVRRARSSSEPGPKVVVERTSSPRPVASERSPVPAPESREALSTFVPGKVLRRRVAVALVAGLLIVLISFVGMRLTARPEAPAPAVTAATEAPESPPAVSPAIPEPTPPATQDPVVAARPTATEAPSRPVHAASAPSSRHHAGSTEPGDLGEFKTKF